MRSITRVNTVIAMILTLFLAVGTSGHIMAQSTPIATPVQQDGIRVMTYNTHHSAGNDDCEDPDTAEGEIPDAECALNLERVADVIAAENPTIVGLQEVDRFWARSGSVDQPEVFAEHLGMNVCFGANLDHSADDHADEQHQYGVATLSVYPILDCENIFLPTTEGWEQRGMLITRIDVPTVGEVVVINTHMQANVSGEPEEAARQRIEQAQAIADFVAEQNRPVIVLGDLNAEADSGEIDSLIGSDALLQDSWVLAGMEEGNTIFDGAHGEPTARIDYILVSSHFTVLHAEVIDNEGSRMASDHFPLMVDLTIGDIGTPQATPVAN